MTIEKFFNFELKRMIKDNETACGKYSVIHKTDILDIMKELGIRRTKKNVEKFIQDVESHVREIVESTVNCGMWSVKVYRETDGDITIKYSLDKSKVNYISLD